ncbi:MAG: heat-inducible transcriptional repressor HrcA [Bifidobacterium sp.]|nr:heat-inducible transcriptional repressor HrcA [Bifidobacterium sp.]MCI1864549.1 heat-inducible transcriptional repressor HrcA [Bifidobacterium sp.]
MAQTRRMLVLRAVVEDYIRSHEPIGSSSLTRNHNLRVSPATVRNEMSALENDGYLVQPHTSAGRIPTEKGYRYFVDRLASVVPLSAAQKRGISNFLGGSVSLQDILQRSARLLASITGQVAVVASPALSKSTLRHVELVPVAMNILLVVVITDTGSVAQHTLTMVSMPSPDELSRFAAMVNTRFSGLPLASTAHRLREMAVSVEFPGMHDMARSLAMTFDSMADDEASSELYMAGTSRLAHQRTASDLAPLFDALEEQVVLMRLMSSLSEETSHSGVGVAIGSETHTPGLLHASVVTSGYGHTHTVSAQRPPRDQDQDQDAAYDEQANAPVAFVGSIGLTHMDYAATMAAVRAVARYLTEFISHDEDDQEC